LQILIVDDNTSARKVLAGQLMQLGHSVRTAAGGDEAICCYERLGADVIITDWKMPGTDGLELCRRLRATRNDASPYPYIILLTGHDGPDRFLRGMEAGADDYLVKPLDIRHLQARLIAAERVTTLHKRLFEASRTDALTGLANRLRLNERLASLREQVETTGMGVTLALCDIDFFKRFNDRYGHLEGDLALWRVAEVLRNGVEGIGLAYRFGGEEFCLVIESLPPPATEALEAIRQNLERSSVLHESSELGVLTISIGASTLRPGDGKSTDQLLSEADTALYQAKAFGRNQLAPKAFERLSQRQTAG
jgi:diguanylate cyclase (GGDEF)-like protein